MNDVDVFIIGAGFGGLGMAIALKRAGRERFIVAEQDAGVGGTWWANRYPGAACDIPSLLYSFSFAPWQDWTRRYPEQPEIAAYLSACVPRFGLEPHLRLSTRVTALEWQADTRRWRVGTMAADGTPAQHAARVVVSATGALSRPRLPTLAGLERFEGLVCHTARWDDRIGTTRGQRVGVVGTGASAIQLVPPLVARGADVTLFQRTPPWILPKRDRALSPLAHALRRRVPGWQRLARGVVYAQHEWRAPAFTRHPEWLRASEAAVLAYLRHKVPPGPLRDALTPNYRLGCKRILLSDDFYAALQQPNAHLVNSPVEEVLPHGVRTADGGEHRLDALVLATGFDAADARLPFPVHGRDGVELNALWRERGAHAHLGSTLPGFPNLFLIVGPNTGLGHNSMIFMIESQVRFVMDALAKLDRAVTVEVKAEAMARFDAELQRRLARTVWASGCQSWYRAHDGRITTLWPGSTLEFRRRTRTLSPTDYHVS